MLAYDEAYRLRAEDADADDDLSRDPVDEAAGAPVRVGLTASGGSYPTSANVFYKIEDSEVTGTETEGSAGAVTGDDSFFYAYNCGTAAPPVGTKVVCTLVPYRWVFNFNG
jgi:hypothetical protein